MWQIIGAGAIGCLNAAHLLRTGEEVHLITRKEIHSTTLKLVTAEQQKHDFNISSSQFLLNAHDPILVCVKAMQVIEALSLHRKFIGENQVIILMHNGMGCAEQVATSFPNNPIICATTSNAALLQGVFNVQETGKGITLFGSFNTQAKAFKELIIPFTNALGNADWQDNINEKQWLKLMINIAINPLTAIYQIKNGALQSEKMLDIITSIVEECLQVTSKLGLAFKSKGMLSMIAKVIKSTSENYSSMNRDIFYQRQTEIEFINGYLLKKGAELDIQLPLVQSYYDQIIMLENRSPTQ